MSPRLLYRVVAIAEAVTWTLLIAAMLLKYVVLGGAAGDAAVSIAGFAHGLVFLAYALTALLVGINQRWRLPLLALAIVTAGIPYAAVVFETWSDRTGRLSGPWQRTATADRRDNTPQARSLRWMLRHPALLATGFVVALAAIMTVLLLNGPPVSFEA